MRPALTLSLFAPALAAAAAFQPTHSIGDGVFRALNRLGATATPFCVSLLGLPRTVTETETKTPTNTVYVVVATETVYDPGCITTAPLVPRGNIPLGFGVGGGLFPTGLLPFPTGLISSACSELGEKVFPWKTTETVTKTADVADATTVEVVKTTTVCTGKACVKDGGACERSEDCCSGACGTTDDVNYFCFQAPK
ncbi:hypothetical protein B0T14DRAFT_563758 [Immersiella caudata]|uniref:Uncharacterized protein n=1 Tax=Immersiella caudata TaxID=314043 RepID=A0AA40C1W2_9PEZI|nr:hypothetical protein B0T14DRAFT_563758 [Immersiella caudata]